MRFLKKTYSTIVYIISRLLILVEFFLFLRLVLKFLNANPKALVVGLIYRWSDILVSPFNFIFPDVYWPRGRLIDTATLSAMIGYAILVFIIFQILQLIFKE
ncbi:hypothetical protein KJA15_04055 [Patescibacteria group bacterium]|nr:hypothetical protein [Patescibacteria group bacterium]